MTDTLFGQTKRKRVIRMLANLVTSLIASAIVMKRSMDWHKRVLYVSIPLFVLFTIVQTGYIVNHLSKNR